MMKLLLSAIIIAAVCVAIPNLTKDKKAEEKIETTTVNSDSQKAILTTPEISQASVVQPSISTTKGIQNIKKVEATALDMDFPYDVELMDAYGKTVKSSELFEKGKPTVMLFWLTTCPPCKMKFAAIEKKYAQWKKESDFNLVAISVDYEKNSAKFSDMVKQKNWPWPTYRDVNLDFKKIMPSKLNGLPQEFVFDAKGNQVHYKKGYKSGYEDMLYAQIKKHSK